MNKGHRARVEIQSPSTVSEYVHLLVKIVSLRRIANWNSRSYLPDDNNPLTPRLSK